MAVRQPINVSEASFAMLAVAYQGLVYALSVLLTLQEGFHVLAHLNVLFRYQPPTLEEIKTRRYYFVWDGISHVIPWFFHGRFLPYILVQFIAHSYYVIGWNEKYYAIRIRDWSAKEYKGKYFTYDFYLTCSDILGHCLNAYALSQVVVGSWILILWWVPYPLLMYYMNMQATKQ